MTNKEYTNEDIISSLELIATTGNCNECKIRNCKWGTCNCSQITANAALELINRQKDEIERLKEFIVETRRCDKEIKFEAVKEFAEKVKKELLLLKKECRKELDNDGVFAIERARKKIDNLVKEMVVDDNACDII